MSANRLPPFPPDISNIPIVPPPAERKSVTYLQAVRNPSMIMLAHVHRVHAGVKTARTDHMASCPECQGGFSCAWEEDLRRQRDNLADEMVRCIDEILAD